MILIQMIKEYIKHFVLNVLMVKNRINGETNVICVGIQVLRNVQGVYQHSLLKIKNK